MTPLIQCKNLDFSVGGPLLIDNASCVINAGERIGLVGRNGTGKSTFLKLLFGTHQPDDGELIRQNGLKIGQLIQDIPTAITDSITTVIASGHDSHADILTEYFRQPSDNLSLEIQNAMTEHDLWSDVNAAQTLVSKFTLNPDTAFSSLSGGMKRRVLLARALINNPQLLLLDEPTNHLDINTIEWLESFLKKSNIAQVIVSHDRAFLNQLCSRIVEIDRGQLISWNGNYDDYQAAKAKALEEEERHNAKFDKRLAEEEAWIRQGIKARRTRNEGRVRALKAMREQRRARREQQGSANFTLQEQGASGKRVIKVRNVSLRFNDQLVINNFSTNIVRGDKIGIIGDNGCGKSTLVKILTGNLQPDSGTVKLGTHLEIAYLDQLRSDINENLSVLDNIAGGREHIDINGNSRHIISYAQDFLFSPEKARGPVTALSGGERNRLLLAKLFTRPCNLLVLDEPTNDLDMETLELLENLLVEYQGTLILVSHDRAFLNNVVSSTLVFENDHETPGIINEYIGGYDDWLWQRKPATKNNKVGTPSTSKETAKTATATPKKKKLGFNEQRELDALPQKIETLEASLAEQAEQMNAPSFYQQDKAEITAFHTKMAATQEELDHCYLRWEELDG